MLWFPLLLSSLGTGATIRAQQVLVILSPINGATQLRNYRIALEFWMAVRYIVLVIGLSTRVYRGQLLGVVWSSRAESLMLFTCTILLYPTVARVWDSYCL